MTGFVEAKSYDAICSLATSHFARRREFHKLKARAFCCWPGLPYLVPRDR